MHFFNFPQYFQPLVNFLHVNPHFAGIITFFIVFIEAMAVVGVIVPGSVTMTAIGVLIGSNVIPAGSTFAWGIAGAIVGDELSYLLGIYYKDRLRRVWPFTRYPDLLNKSEVFFHKHGGKSVFIGRFFGPMRAMVPMVAGMLKMPQGRFLLAAIPSAAMWAVLYILPGVILGALSSELSPKTATQFVLGAFGILIFLWLITWVLQHSARRFYRWLDSYVMRCWLFMQRNPTLQLAYRVLNDPREPDNHQQLFLLLLFFISAIVFFVIFTNVLSQGSLTIFNSPIYYFLSSLRTMFLDRLIVPITFLGQDDVLLVAGSLFGVWLVYKRYWYIAIHWLLLLFTCLGSVIVVKYLVFSPRPGALLDVHQTFHHNSSFPSGHTAISVALYGFWAVVIAREIQVLRRWFLYAAVGVVVTLIALSRLYLGAHWLTDVLGGLMLGLSIVFFFTISYRRRHTLHFSLKSFAWVSVSLLFSVWLVYSAVLLNKQLAEYSIKWPDKTITLQTWQSQIGETIPLFRTNRVGRPAQAFNVEWLGNIDKIEKNLLAKGWEKQPASVSLREFAGHLVEDNVTSHLPWLNQLHHNRSSVLLMTKETDEQNTVLILRLWQSDIRVIDNKDPLWLGVIERHSNASSKFLGIPHRDKHTPKFVGAAEALQNYLPDFTGQQITIAPEKQPQELKGLKWSGKVFVVQSKSR